MTFQRILLALDEVTSPAVGKTELPPLLVPLPLAQPVAFRPRRIVLAPFRSVARMFRTPILRAIPAHLPIQRIGGDLPPMVIVAAQTVARRITASGQLSRSQVGFGAFLVSGQQKT